MNSSTENKSYYEHQHWKQKSKGTPALETKVIMNSITENNGYYEQQH